MVLEHPLVRLRHEQRSDDRGHQRDADLEQPRHQLSPVFDRQAERLFEHGFDRHVGQCSARSVDAVEGGPDPSKFDGPAEVGSVGGLLSKPTVVRGLKVDRAAVPV